MAGQPEPGYTPTNNTPGPVVTVGGVQAVLGALVALGWLNLDSTAVAAIATAVCAVVGAVVAVYGRKLVTPVANPRDATGAPLVPAGSAEATPTPPGQPVSVAELVGRHAKKETASGDQA